MSPFKKNQNIVFVIALFCSILICADVLAREGIDVGARKKLVSKYKNALKADLEFLLLKEKKTDEQMRDFFNMIVELNDDKSAKMTELLVDLIDFHIGEITDCDIYQHISTREKKTAIPLLKKKLPEKPLSFEQDLKERNENIAELLRRIINGVKYINNPSLFDPVETLKSWLFEAQMDLEKYYYTNGIYPEKLSDAFITPFPEIGGEVVIIYGVGKRQRIKYKSFGSTYFIGTAGKDGVLGTKDDVIPPYLSEIYCFPGAGEKRGKP
jgi:hypothetical protein